MRRLKRHAINVAVFWAASLSVASAQGDQPIGMEEAVRIALGARDPTVVSHELRATALDEEAIADAQLPDPQLKLGFVNWPTDSFSYDQEQMTQIQVGAVQNFPQGSTLRFQKQKREAEASAERATAKLQELTIALNVRRLWLELYYLDGAFASVNRSQEAVRELIEAIESSFATGRQSYQDLLRADLEQDLLKDRIIDIVRQSDLIRASLARFIGQEAAKRKVTADLPDLGPIPAKEQIADSLLDHPGVSIEDQRIAIHDNAAGIANEQYKPSWGIEARYGARGGGEADFASLMLTMSLPLFTNKRQDKRLSAAKLEKQAARQDRSARLLDLKQQLDRAYADWLRFGERIELYQDAVIDRARDTTEGAVDSYENQTSDFAELIRARLAELEVKLQLLRLRVDRAQSEATLVFLLGGTP